MSEVTGTLENWQATEEIEDGMCVIWGHIFNDTELRFKDDTWIHTSGVKLVDFKEGDIISTMNSQYLLGKQGT